MSESNKTNPKRKLDRRDFNQLAISALGGLIAGSSLGCSGSKENAGTQTNSTESTENQTASDETKVVYNDWLSEVHVCRGLNACKNQGFSGSNECAGQGDCATTSRHDCQGHNDCQFEGGCGNKPGQNDCKGQGKCAVPLLDRPWGIARKAFKQAMIRAKKEVGAAPPRT